MQSQSAYRAAGVTRFPVSSAHRCSAQRRKQLACQAARAAVTSTTQQASTPLQRHERLNNPAEIGARGAATVNVKDMGHAAIASGENVSLDAYMRLPVEQYYILDPNQIQFLSGNKFILSVPRIQLLGASLEPVIEVQVTSEQDAVVLQATDCQLNATGIMGGLDSKFALQFQTRLTWNSHTHSHLPKQQQQHQQFQVVPQPHNQLTQQQQQQQQQQQPPQQPAGSVTAPMSTATNGNDSKGIAAAAQAQLRTGWDRIKNVSWRSNANGNGHNGNGAAVAQQQVSSPGSITGSAYVQVWCEVVPPFQLMPRDMLERSCNVVISGLVNSLLPWFMRQLAADYQKWAADANYRAERRLRTAQKRIV